MKIKLLGLIAISILLLALLLIPTEVYAHATIVRSNPPANGSLPTGKPPTQIQAWYSEELEIKFSRLEVIDQTNQRVDNNDSKLAPGDTKSLIVSLKPNLPDGSYTVLSFAASAVDGHVVKSSFAFVVGTGAPLIIASPIDLAFQGGISPDSNVFSVGGIFGVLMRWLNYVGSTALAGGLFFYLVVWRGSYRKLLKKGRIGTEVEESDQNLTQRSHLLINFSLLLLAMAWLGWLVVQTANFSGQSVAQLFGFSGGGRGFGAFADFLFGSRYGAIWLARLGLIVLAALVWFVFARHPKLPNFTRKITNPATLAPQSDLSSESTVIPAPENRFWWVVFGLGAAILLTTSLNSHAGSSADYAFLAVFNDWLHLLGTAFWIGGLFFMTLCLPVALKPLVPGSGDKTRLLAVLLPTFSQLAILSVALLGITGSVSAFIQTGDLADLFATGYGVTLTVKLGVVFVLLLIGFYNQQVLIPKIRQYMRVSATNKTAGAGSVAAGKTAIQIKRTLWVEAVLGVLLLLVVGVLTSQAPPSSISGAIGGVIFQQKEANDLKVSLAISPGQLGDNTFEVAIADARSGQAIVNADDVRLNLSMREMDMSSPFLVLKPTDQSKGRYLAQGSVLSMKGNWDVVVMIKRAGKEDATINFNFKIR